MERFALQDLIAWSEQKTRKPLIIRGARQVGKTWLAKEFGRQRYERTVYLNFDLDANPEHGSLLHTIFNSSLDPNRIITALEIAFEEKIDPDSCLLIFDEAQEQPRALNALKYFNEQAPQYQIIAAGSHLGMNLHAGTSFPVGNVSFLYLYPLSFKEFLLALDRPQLANLLKQQDWETIQLLHQEIKQLLRLYYCIGGMPEVVASYQTEQSLFKARKLQREILELFRADFSKHAPANQLVRIWQVWDSIPIHLSKENKKLIWNAVRPSARANEYEIALQWLFDYGLAYRVSRIDKPGYPLESYADPDHFKLFLLDVGLLGAMSGLDVRAVLEGDALFTEFKGALTEQYVCQELVLQFEGGHYGGKPYYWTGKQAEIDFVVSLGGHVTPIEVKAAENLRSQSLKSYVERYAPACALRTSLSPYREQENLTNIPLYGVSEIESVIRKLTS